MILFHLKDYLRFNKTASKMPTSAGWALRSDSLHKIVVGTGGFYQITFRAVRNSPNISATVDLQVREGSCRSTAIQLKFELQFTYM